MYSWSGAMTDGVLPDSRSESKDSWIGNDGSFAPQFHRAETSTKCVNVRALATAAFTATQRVMMPSSQDSVPYSSATTQKFTVSWDSFQFFSSVKGHAPATVWQTLLTICEILPIDPTHAGEASSLTVGKFLPQS